MNALSMEPDPSNIKTTFSGSNELLFVTRSEEMQEITGHRPPWIIRKGIGALTIILLGIMATSAWIKFPELTRLDITIPAGAARMAVGYVNMADAHKIKPGQSIMIMLSNIPSGSLKGVVTRVSPAADNDRRVIDISLDDGFTGARQHRPDSMQVIKGVGEINTSDKTLLQTLFDAMFTMGNK